VPWTWATSSVRVRVVWLGFWAKPLLVWNAKNSCQDSRLCVWRRPSPEPDPLPVPSGCLPDIYERWGGGLLFILFLVSFYLQLLEGNFALFCSYTLGFRNDFQNILLAIMVSVHSDGRLAQTSRASSIRPAFSNGIWPLLRNSAGIIADFCGGWTINRLSNLVYPVRTSVQ